MTKEDTLYALKLIVAMRNAQYTLIDLPTDLNARLVEPVLEYVRGRIEPLLRCFTPIDGRYVAQGNYFDDLADALLPIVTTTERQTDIPEYKEKLKAVIAEKVPHAIAALDKIEQSLAQN